MEPLHPLEVSGRALTIREQRAFESGFAVSLLVLVLGALGYYVGPFAGQPKVAVTVAGVGALAAVLAFRWISRHELRARLDDEGVAVWNAGNEPGTPVPWKLVVGYRDDDPEVVRLELGKRVGLASRLTVPTLTEPERLAVLAHLDARRIPRLD